MQTGLRTRDIDPRLVRLVTRHFNGLQGLFTAMLGFILAIADWTWLSSGSALFTGLAAVYAFLGAIVPAALYGGDFYARLGRVVMAPRAWRVRGFFARFISTYVFLLLLQVQTHLPGFPSLIWLVASAYPAWLAFDGWPYRSYQLITCAAAIYVAFGRPIAAHPGDFMWAAPRLWVFALALIATGIADHLLLFKVMRPLDDEAEEIESSHVDPI